MRQALLFSTALILLASACGYPRRSTEISGQTQLTSGPGIGEPELGRTIGTLSERLADEVCLHETRCGRPDSACVADTVARASEQLSGWNCSPAAIRARIEECLAGIDEVSCDVDARAASRLCPSNAACGQNAELISPGRALAERAR
jgi:hypothetical protein